MTELAINVIPQSLGTAKRKDGDDFEIMLNITAEVQQPDDHKVAWLFRASRTQQALYLNRTLCRLSSLRVKRPTAQQDEKVTAVFVALDPDINDVTAQWRNVRASQVTPVTAGQGELPLEPPPAGSVNGDDPRAGSQEMHGFHPGDKVTILETDEPAVVSYFKRNEDKVVVIDQDGAGQAVDVDPDQIELRSFVPQDA